MTAVTRLLLDHVSKNYRGARVLDDLSLAVERGEIVAVCGPSGGGKTVLLRLIAGTIVPDAGDVRIDGTSVVGRGPEERDVGMAFQNFALYPHLPAFENIASPLRARQRPEDEIRRRVHTIAELLRIDHVLHHLPRALSNGQKQRTALARSLVSGPSVLLLDDPLRNVDAKLRYEMRFELPRLLMTFNATVLYVTQDYREAMAFGERVAVLDGGRFVQVARPDAVYREPETLEIAKLFGDPTINTYPVTPAADGSVDLFGRRLALGNRLAALAGRPCTLGLRPEHIAVHPEPGEHRIPMELDAVTPLSHRAVLLMRTPGGEEVLALTGEDTVARLPQHHGTVHVAIDPDRVLAFDGASALRVAGRP
jgi:multiple sugar transport system ATP-binding protein